MENLNLNLEGLDRKQVTIDGDPNRVLEINPNDILVINRFYEVAPKLENIGNEIRKVILDETEESDMTSVIAEFAKFDKEVRDIVDYIFATNVCDVCMPYGSMFSFNNGEFAFETLITKVLSLYTDSIKAEYDAQQKANAKVAKHTAKYTGK